MCGRADVAIVSMRIGESFGIRGGSVFEREEEFTLADRSIDRYFICMLYATKIYNTPCNINHHTCHK